MLMRKTERDYIRRMDYKNMNEIKEVIFEYLIIVPKDSFYPISLDNDRKLELAGRKICVLTSTKEDIEEGARAILQEILDQYNAAYAHARKVRERAQKQINHINTGGNQK